MLFLSFILLLIGSPAPNSTARFLAGMRVGDSWTYQGRVRWTVENSSIVKSREISWTTRLIAKFSFEHNRTAVFSGLPIELAWFEPGQKPHFTVLYEGKSGLFIHKATSREDAIAVARSGLLAADRFEQLLAYPVIVGRCVERARERNDDRYCWLVTRTVAYRRNRGWELRYVTNPDDQTLDIVPGIGVTQFEYHHHGTVAATEVHLTAFRHAPEPPLP